MVSDLGLRIDGDRQRFWHRYRKLIKDKLTDYIRHDGFVISDDEKGVSVSVPEIEIPQFRYVRQKGPTADWIPQARQKDHPKLKVDFPLDMIVDILIEKMELPRLKPSTNKDLAQLREAYTSLRRHGPASLRHPRRTLRAVLQRNMVRGDYVTGQPFEIRPEDFRYRAARATELPGKSAVLIYLMDTSPSMGVVEKRIAKTDILWLDAILERQYKVSLGEYYHGIRRRYVMHSDHAVEASNRQDFFEHDIGGGTLVYEGLKKVAEIILEERAAGTENIYVFHYSDGDVYAPEDLQNLPSAIRVVAKNVNRYGYTQIRNQPGSFVALGPHGPEQGLMRIFLDNVRPEIDQGIISTSYIASEDGAQILASIKQKLKEGK